MFKLTEIIEIAKKQQFNRMEIFNPKGKDLIFKGVELVQLKSWKERPIEGLPENGCITVYMTDKGNFVILDDRTLQQDGPTVVTNQLDLDFGFYGFDKAAKELYKQLGIEKFWFV